MPDNISSARIEPLGSSAEKEAEYAQPRAQRPKIRVPAAVQAAAPLIDVEAEEEHQLDEQA
jgi:hypothetical protein